MTAGGRARAASDCEIPDRRSRRRGVAMSSTATKPASSMPITLSRSAEPRQVETTRPPARRRPAPPGGGGWGPSRGRRVRGGGGGGGGGEERLGRRVEHVQHPFIGVISPAAEPEYEHRDHEAGGGGVEGEGREGLGSGGSWGGVGGARVDRKGIHRPSTACRARVMASPAYSDVLPSKCSVSASASARVRCTTPSR